MSEIALSRPHFYPCGVNWIVTNVGYRTFASAIGVRAERRHAAELLLMHAHYSSIFLLCRLDSRRSDGGT